MSSDMFLLTRPELLMTRLSLKNVLASPFADKQNYVDSELSLLRCSLPTIPYKGPARLTFTFVLFSTSMLLIPSVVFVPFAAAIVQPDSSVARSIWLLMTDDVSTKVSELAVTKKTS